MFVLRPSFYLLYILSSAVAGSSPLPHTLFLSAPFFCSPDKFLNPPNTGSGLGALQNHKKILSAFVRNPPTLFPLSFNSSSFVFACLIYIPPSSNIVSPPRWGGCYLPRQKHSFCPPLFLCLRKLYFSSPCASCKKLILFKWNFFTSPLLNYVHPTTAGPHIRERCSLFYPNQPPFYKVKTPFPNSPGI